MSSLAAVRIYIRGRLKKFCCVITPLRKCQSLVDRIPIGARRSWPSLFRGRVCRPSVPQEFDTLCVANIARFKRPKAYVFLDALPKNNYGKIVKAELRALSK